MSKGVRHGREKARAVADSVVSWLEGHTRSITVGTVAIKVVAVAGHDNDEKGAREMFKVAMEIANGLMGDAGISQLSDYTDDAVVAYKRLIEQGHSKALAAAIVDADFLSFEEWEKAHGEEGARR